MDGPTVNWSFFKKFTEILKKDGNYLVNIGSCGLHKSIGHFKPLYNPQIMTLISI